MSFMGESLDTEEAQRREAEAYGSPYRTRSVKVAATVMNGALYAVVGYLIYLYLPIIVYGVRFWPSVIVPAVFASLFGPVVGGVGAALGIFISDVLIHGEPLLSLTVGVPSNFLGFFILGYLARREARARIRAVFLLSGGGIAVLTLVAYALGNLAPEQTLLVLGIDAAAVAPVLAIARSWPLWRSYGMAAVAGLGVGSLIIGFGVWGYTQVFVSKWLGGSPLPFYVSLVVTAWTYASEMPFLIVVVPPVLKGIYSAFPGFAPPWLRAES
ncbi:MAG: hypothetical protein QW057_08930 [Candidatus Bathyarchaeia archaeon]